MADATSATPKLHPALDLVVDNGVPHAADLDDRVAIAIDGRGVVAVESLGPNAWRLFFGDTATRDLAVDELSTELGSRATLTPLDVEDDGWATRVQESLKAVEVGRFIIAPPWDVPGEGAADRIVLVVEPSTGFGTGHHQSTRLSVRLLETLPLEGCRLIDVGTGSGVLAMAARRLGATDLVAFDVDDDAVAAARANVARNGLDGITLITATLGDLDEAPADVVVANLTMFLLREKREALTRLVAPGGRLVTSGFTIEQEALVVDAFASAFDVERRDEEDGWVVLGFRRRDARQPSQV